METQSESKIIQIFVFRPHFSTRVKNLVVNLILDFARPRKQPLQYALVSFIYRKKMCFLGADDQNTYKLWVFLLAMFINIFRWCLGESCKDPNRKTKEACTEYCKTGVLYKTCLLANFTRFRRRTRR
jgi:hypothetical protein